MGENLPSGPLKTGLQFLGETFDVSRSPPRALRVLEAGLTRQFLAAGLIVKNLRNQGVVNIMTQFTTFESGLRARPSGSVAYLHQSCFDSASFVRCGAQGPREWL